MLTCVRRADFEDGRGCETGRQAGAIAALLTAVSVSVGLLHALCMPCSAHVTHPHQPRAALRQVSRGAEAPPPFAEAAPWCQPALRCLCLPTNGYISKRMARVHAQAETGVRPAPSESSYRPRLSYAPFPMVAMWSPVVAGCYCPLQSTNEVAFIGRATLSACDFPSSCMH